MVYVNHLKCFRVMNPLLKNFFPSYIIPQSPPVDIYLFSLTIHETLLIHNSLC